MLNLLVWKLKFLIENFKGLIVFKRNVFRNIVSQILTLIFIVLFYFLIMIAEK